MADKGGSFFDDVTKFGSGALDSVGESLDNILGSMYPPRASSNPAATQQPSQSFADNNGNAVTAPQGAIKQGMSNDMLMLIGGGFGLLIVMLIVVLATKK